MPRPLLVLPTLNEELGLRRTLEELDRVRRFPTGGPPSVLVVDGHSTDGTVDVAHERGDRVLVQTTKGKGGAVREGLEWARAHGFDSVGVIDADATYPVGRLPALYDLLGGGHDVVIGVRYPVAQAVNTARDLVHRIGNCVLNLCAAQFGRGPILDVCSGFWGLRTELVPQLALTSDGFDVEAELFVKAFRQGLRVVQIPVEYRPRIGNAKLHAVRDGARILLAIIRHAGHASEMVRPVSPTEESFGRATGLPALHTLLQTLDPPNVVVVSGPDQRTEAARVARSIERYWLPPDTVVVSSPAGPTFPPFAATIAAGSANGGRSGNPVVISFARSGGAPPPIRVEVPGRQRAVVLHGDRRNEPAGSNRDSIAGRAAHRLLTPGTLGILGAALDRSGQNKQLAMIAANLGSALVEFRPLPSSRPLRGSAPRPAFGFADGPGA